MTFPVGESIQRVDGQEKVSGRAVYTGDMHLPGMLHGKVLRSPLPHARIRRINAGKAKALPGVVSVLTGETMRAPSPYLGTQIKDQPVLALEKVRYVGDIVAAVAATSEAIAEEALRRIEVDYEELPAVVTIDDALQGDAPLVHHRIHRDGEPKFGRGCSYHVHEASNICHHFRYQRGDLDEGFAAADFAFEDTFLFPSAHHCAMEPHTSLADCKGGEVTIWSAAQSPFPLRREICRIFGIPENRIRVIIPYVGGGFGGQKSRTTAVLAVALSQVAQQPVRVLFSSEECFHTICQPQMKVTVRTGLSREGTFIARHCQVYLNSGAYTNNSPSVTNKAGYRAHGPYRIPCVQTDAYDIYTNTVPAGSFRGFGAQQVAFAYESHLDMIARRLQMDPVELRMRNLLNRNEEYAPGDTPIDCDIKQALQQVASAIGWGHSSPAGTEPGRRKGKGIACGMKDAGGTAKTANASVKILRNGSVVLFAGSVEIGQGVRTALSQVAARELAISPDQVHFADVDTKVTPFDTGTHSSSSTAIMGRAVVEAARNAGNQILSAAASVLGLNPTELALENGDVVAPQRRMSFQEVMERAFGGDPREITGKGSFGFQRKDAAPLGYPSPFWEIGLGAAEVEVDEISGEVKILSYFSVTDAGTVIHPLQCRGQDEGSIVFGIGQTLSEELLYQDGRLASSSLGTYRVPRFTDLPETFSTRVLEHHGGPGPYGAKGVGEAAILAVAPAVCNAIYDAVGVRLQQVPLTPERVWRAMAGAGGGPGQPQIVDRSTPPVGKL